MSLIPQDVIDKLKARHPVPEIAGRRVTLRRKPGARGTWVGPCPICSRDRSKKSATRFECDDVLWRCAVCQDGGDVIRLVARLDGRDPVRDFRDIVEALGGGDAGTSPEEARRQGRTAHGAGVPLDRPPADIAAEAELIAAWRAGWQAAAERAAKEARYRERERRRLWDFWQAAAPIAGTPVEAYLALRGVVPPPGAGLRYAADHILFGSGREIEPPVVHRGPAMLAEILGPDGRFAALHATWIDLAAEKGKVGVIDPATGEVVPAKKVRGTKVGGRIVITSPPEPAALVIGEGIEKVIAVENALRLAGRNLSRTAFWTSVDLGNLGGRARETVEHPHLTVRCGRGERPQRVPGPEPDMTAPSIPIPDSVRMLVLLGDSTSDRFTTENALRRAGARWARPGRTIRIVWAPEGTDFDDVMRTDTAAWRRAAAGLDGEAAA